MGKRIPPIENPCQINCMCCKEYESVTEQNKKCESKRERSRERNRMLREAMKK